LDGRFLDRAVHALDLTIGPRMLDLGQPMFDAIRAVTRRVLLRAVSLPSGLSTAHSKTIWQCKPAALLQEEAPIVPGPNQPFAPIC
jgi:hypothetical protein